MDATINNIDDLRFEIERLKVSKKAQEIAIKSHFNGPVAIFTTLMSFFSSSASSLEGLLGNQDLFGLLSRFILPFTLNKTIFRHSNFIIKTLVGLFSQKASVFINKDNVSSVWDKIRSMLPGKKEATKKVAPDYGIPPFSESY